MLKLLKYLSIVAVLVAGLSTAWFWFISEGLKKQQEDIYGALNKMTAGEFKNDILFIGSSRTQHHINPAVIDSITGLESYNLGADGVTIVECYMFLKLYLEKNPVPKFVVLNIDMPMFDTDKGIYRVNQYFPYLDNATVYNTLTPFDTKVDWARYAPFIGGAFYSDRAVNYAIQGWVNPNRDKYTYTKGFIPYEEKWSDAQAQKMASHRAKTNITKSGMKHLQDVFELCREKDIRLILSFGPEYTKMPPIVVNSKDIKIEISAFAGAQNVWVSDYYNSPISKDKSYFKDPQHLNQKGAQWFSEQLGQLLKELSSN